MPSTYSPNLRIELIGNGEQSGTWGSTTNTNLGTLIESAIAGYVDVPVTSTSQALTALAGVDDQSRNMVVAFPSSLESPPSTVAGNFTIYIPPAEKLYIFNNRTAYSATISAATAVNGTTPTGGATITIPAGKTMIVFCDADDVREGSNHIAGNLSVAGGLSVTGATTVSGALTADSLSLNTPLPVASGGTGVVTITAGTIPRGNGTSPLSPASAADIVANIGSTAVQNATFATSAGSATSATSATTATNIAGGGTNRIPYNTGAGVTSFIAAPTLSAQFLKYDGSSLVWDQLPASGVLSVTASSPLASSGGANPNISFTGILGETNGGTAQSTYATGDLLYASGANTLAKRTIGTTGQVLTVSGGVPAWASLPSSVTSFSAGTTGLTPSTGTSGAVTLAGTLAIANGGTGATSAAAARTALGAGTVSSVTVSAGTGMSGGGTVTGSGTITLTNAGATSIKGQSSDSAQTGAVVLTNLASFANSLGASGYQKLPGGLIIQWGTSGAITTTAAVPVTFPITFPTACVNVQVSWQGTPTDNYALWVTNKSTTGFSVYNTDGTPGAGSTALWFAVGY